MSDNPFNEFADIFFNGRPFRRGETKHGITIQELIRRKESTILVDGKLYRVTIEPAEVAPKQAK